MSCNCKADASGIYPAFTPGFYRSVALANGAAGVLMPEGAGIVSGPFIIKLSNGANTLSQQNSLFLNGTQRTANLQTFGGDYKAWLTITGFKLRLEPKVEADLAPTLLASIRDSFALTHTPAGKQAWTYYADEHTEISPFVRAISQTTPADALIGDIKHSKRRILYPRPVNHESDNLIATITLGTFTGDAYLFVDGVWVNKADTGSKTLDQLWSDGSSIDASQAAVASGVGVADPAIAAAVDPRQAILRDQVYAALHGQPTDPRDVQSTISRVNPTLPLLVPGGGGK